RRLLATIPDVQPVVDQLEWGDFLIQGARPGTFRNPPGFYFSLVRDDIRPPAAFESSRQRGLREEARSNHERAHADRAHLQLLYDQYQGEEARRALESLPAAQRAERIAERQRDYARR